MRVVHINQSRYNAILAQGRPLTVTVVNDDMRPIASLYSGRTVYHTIDGEYGYCDKCDGLFDSIQATTPVDLENDKLSIPCN